MSPAVNGIVIHGGGPTPVINGSLYGVIVEAQASDAIGELFGAARGMSGLLDEKFHNLSTLKREHIDGLLSSPGSAIGSSRYKVKEEDYEKIIEVLKKHNIHYAFLNGGNDTMDTTHHITLSAQRMNYDLTVIGIPKTIDNDLIITDHCPGYGSAARYIAVSTRELDQDNRSLPVPVSVLEVMGRNTGWLAASSALAKRTETDGPHLIYLPERPVTIEQILKDVEAVYKKLHRAVVVVSEGIRDTSGAIMAESDHATNVDAFGHKLPGNVSVYVSGAISQHLGIRARNEKPGLLGRTSIVHMSKTDQDEAVALGREAVKRAAAGESDVMLTIERRQDDPYEMTIGTAPLSEVANKEKFMPEEWITKEGNGVTEDFLIYASPLIGGPLPEFVSFNV